MKFQATVKLLQEVKSGISKNTGNEYKYQGVILETQDGERTARWLASLGTEMVNKVEAEHIMVGSQVIVDLSFTTVMNYNKYVDNKVYVNEIASIQTPQTPQTPSSLPLKGEGGYGNLPQEKTLSPLPLPQPCC